MAIIGAAALLLLLAALVVTACGEAGTTTTIPAGGTTGSVSSTAGGGGGGGGGGAQVTIKGFAFDPASVTIKTGEGVTWTNEDSATHDVVADGGEFSSGDILTGDTYSFTFDKAGTYPYICGIHPSMKGTVVVE
ncbi:MAG: hypothetical protein A2W26_01975 [Acidobacteria bacterium RBG_16_64_8]|nr:MAG: hypothetical protein A2W26_01975 [Acidobacteria bacterium RBG_16_64_8]